MIQMITSSIDVSVKQLLDNAFNKIIAGDFRTGVESLMISLKKVLDLLQKIVKIQ
jgi:hypothetical protein